MAAGFCYQPALVFCKCWMYILSLFSLNTIYHIFFKTKFKPDSSQPKPIRIQFESATKSRNLFGTLGPTKVLKMYSTSINNLKNTLANNRKRRRPSRHKVSMLENCFDSIHRLLHTSLCRTSLGLKTPTAIRSRSTRTQVLRQRGHTTPNVLKYLIISTISTPILSHSFNSSECKNSFAFILLFIFRLPFLFGP